jgi:ubiquinone/menaquinone biosynthesis C-methylase UbiE
MFFNYTNIIDPILKSVRVEMLKIAALKKDSVVLDVCCGTGDQAFYYAKVSDCVFGIDLDPVMIDFANKKKQKQNSTACFKVADASNLPFNDNYFDIVSICLALHEKNEELRNKIISEMKRVAKKGGEIMIVDYTVPMPDNFTAWFIRTIEWFAGKEHFNYFNEYLKKGGLKELLKQNNLSVQSSKLIANGTMELIKTVN